MSETSVPPLGPNQAVDEKAKQVFEAVKHEILHQIWHLHREDERHHLNEARKLEHVKCYKPVSYRIQEEAYGTNYFGKILMDDQGHYIHARVFRSTDGETIKLHAVHNRPRADGGAIFSETDEIEYFEY